MNFLAHIYLSGENTDIKIGNFIADFVKGRNYEKYRENIRKGIILHREIDSFTDSHPLWKHTRDIISEVYGLYSGIVTDIFYDYCFASTWEKYTDIPLKKFSSDFYKSLISNYSVLPKRVQLFLPFFVASDRLYSYSSISGIRQALAIMSQRTSLPDFTQQAVELLVKKENEFKHDFQIFFPELISFSVEKSAKL